MHNNLYAHLEIAYRCFQVSCADPCVTYQGSAR